MELAPCCFRQVLPEGSIRCAMVQQVLGLTTADECHVESGACRACNNLASPTPANPNAVVASLIYNLARDIRRRGGRFDCNVGQAWQAECYARRMLAEEPCRSIEQGQSARQRPLSLCQHTARSRSSAFRSRRPVIGLAGYGAASGLGYLNRDLAEHGAVDTWLLVDHPRFPCGEIPAAGARVERLSSNTQESKVRRWLRNLDWVVWAEISPLDYLAELAQEMGTRIACIPMWEWTSPCDTWLRSVDLLICPTYHSSRLFTDWKRRFGFHWEVAYFPWPVDTERFRFRLRDRCRRFVFINGHGGAWAPTFNADRLIGPRKGLDIVLAAAALTPRVPWIIYTQVDPATSVPANVELRRGPADHSQLYEDADVCVQPSRWEGLGLQLLECQAAGLPLITVDAPPMNEYHPLHSLTSTRWDWACLAEGQPIRAPRLSPEALAEAVDTLYGQDIGAASRAAHDWINREHSWTHAAWRWCKLFENHLTPEADDVGPRARE